MKRLPLSSAASGLLRALVNRAGTERDRILLTNALSIDWQSLTFVGERHEMSFTIIGPDAEAVATRMIAGLEDAEFTIPGQIVADIVARRIGSDVPGGSVSLHVEALTVVS